MGLSCSCLEDYDGEGWTYYTPSDYTTLETKYRKRCCSCKKLIDKESVVAKFIRSRMPQDDIEERIHGDEVCISDWYMCEQCADIFFSLDELGFCIMLGEESMRELAKEYAENYGRP